MRARVIYLVVSWLLVGLGVPMLIRAHLGVSPFDVLNTGVANLFDWELGTAFVVDSVVLYLIGVLLGGRIGPACVPGSVVIGVAVNAVLGMMPEPQTLAVRIPLLVGGLVVIAAAIALAVVSDLGPGPTEVFMLGLMHRGMGVVPARWVSDGLPVLVGAVVGGALGVGTLLFVLTMGPMVKFGLQRLGYRQQLRPTFDLPVVGP